MDDRKVRRVYNQIPALPALYKNVGIYCRVSSRSQEQLHSLSAQASGLVRMISAHANMRLVDIYIDIAGGENFDRPEFSRMLDDAGCGKLDMILTKSISRFGRNTEDTLQALRFLKEKQVQVVFDQENLDTLSVDSELLFSILAGFSEADNKSRRENQRWAITKRLEDGTSEIYTRSCYGYRKDAAGIIDVVLSEAKAVQLIYSSYLNGASIVGIQKILKEEGILSSRGNETWSKRAIENILSNEKYTGSVIARKTIVSPGKGHKQIINETEPRYQVNDIFPAIISKEIFDLVQEERKRRSNVIVDEFGKHRKDSHYSSKKNRLNDQE